MQEVKKFFVYKITNLINNKIYIGKTSGDPDKRFYNHLKFAFYPSVRNNCPKLYRSIRKYGVENFKYEIIQQFEKETDAYNFEGKLIDELKSIKYGMNVRRGGNGAGYGSDNHMYGKGYLISGSKNGMFGMTGSKNPFFGKKHTEQTIQHLKQSKQLLSSQDILYIKNMLENNITYNEIAKKFSISITTVYRIKHGKRG